MAADMDASIIDAESRATRLIDAIGAELASAPFAHQTQERPLERIPAPSEAEAARRSDLARGWRHDLAGIEVSKVAPQVRSLLRVADATISRLEREEPWYWLVQDPVGLGFFGLFGPTAYAGGWHLGLVGQLVAREAARRPDDGDRLLSLAADVGGVVRAMHERLVGQAKRGIRMPAAQRSRAIALVAAAGPRLVAQLNSIKQDGNPPIFRKQLDAIVEQAVRPELERLGAVIADTPVTDTVGMQHLPEGPEVYAELVRHHTTLELGPEEVHAVAVERLGQIRETMAELRSEAQFSGNDAAFAAQLAQLPEQRANDADEIAAQFDQVSERARKRLDKWFRFRPTAPFRAAPLPPELEAGMTFGFYKVPATPAEPGLYLFNSANLVASGTMRLAALTFHELAPGHHIHLASQAANDQLPSLIRYNSFNAFNEGWAEYAAVLAEEEGLYETVGERFGRAVMDAFLTSRLIVDTGIHTRSWSLDQAKVFLMENAFMSAVEAESEAIRYAADQPAQVLAYKLGDTYLLHERERMRAAIGTRFDLRDFHDLVLRSGGRPLPLVRADVDAVIEGVS